MFEMRSAKEVIVRLSGSGFALATLVGGLQVG
jgi:hypothetical protein